GDLVAVKDRENNTTSFKYEAANNPHFLTEVIDSLGRTGVKTGYDDSGRLKQMIDANGSAVELIYDPNNSLQKVKDVFGKETTYVYDARGNVVQKVNVLGGITQQTFDENNKLLTQTDPLGNTTTYAYDSGGNLIYITDPLGNKAYYSYNNFGQVTSRTDPLGNTISYTYDKRRNLLNTTNAEGNTIRETTNQFGNTTSLTDANGNKTRFEYDDFGNVIRQIDAFGNETAYTYNSNGDQITETVKVTTLNGLRQQTTSWTYDSQGRVQTKTNSRGNVIRHEYDILGNLTAVIEEGTIARRTAYRYNAKNQLVETLYADGTSEKSVYDEAGRRIAETDRTNQTTRYIYDALGRLIETIYPDSTPGNLADNPRTKSEYDKAGRITASTDERGNRTEYEYDKAGRRTLVRDALRRETTYTYDAMGNLLTETDALGRTTRYAYDKVGRRTETYLADRTGAITKYNKAGLKVAETNQAGQTTNFVYDALDRLVEVIHPDSTPNDLSNNPRTKTEYNELGWVNASIDELGNRTEYEYDAVGRIIESRSSCACRRKTYTYDEFGNRITETDQLGRTNRFVYDELGRIKQTYFDDNTYTTTAYDDLGRLISITDQAGKKTAFEYNIRGQLVAVVDALQKRTEYGYDFSGNLTSIKDANNNITRYEYDKLGRRIAIILPKEQRSEITYDAVGNVLSAKDLNGKTVTYEYDKLNRLDAEKFPDETSLKYTYTSTGQRQTATETKGGIVRTTTYEYDERDRLISRTEPDGRKVEYTYDKAGNIAAVKTPSGTAINTYDKYNQLKTVTDPDGGLTEYTYDKVGNLIRTKFPNGTVEIREYDKLNRLTFIKNFRIDPVSGQDVVISSYRYTLNATGQRTKVEENSGRIVEYIYDDLYRLIEEKIVDSVAGNRTIQYGYDEIGNRVTRNDSIEGLKTYTYDENDRLLNETLNGQVTTYAYDNNGNLLSRFKNNTDKAVYTWDFENRLIGAQVTDASGTRNIEYRYDADGVRVATIVNGQETRYLIDSNQPHAQVLEEYSPNGNLQASYVYGLDLVSTERGSDRAFYHVDGLGSTRALTNGAGNAIDTYTYDAYGNLIGKTGNTVNNYLYAGEQYDPNLGDYYLRARYYDTETGRFSARDPFEGVLTEPLSLAKYPYVHGNPVNATDPSGLFLQEQSSVMSILTILTTMTYIMGRSPIGTLSTLDGDNALVPGYLKNTSHKGVNKFLNTAITGKNYQIIRKKVQECNTTVGAGNCDLEGFPIIVWGHEIPEITQHTQEAIVQTGQSFLARISPGWNNTPTGRVKKYSNGAEYPAPWYDFTPECPWDNDNPMRYFNSRSGRDCDEYPYNSTLQGGPLNYDAGKVSLKLVNSQQNKTQGVFLGGEFDKNTRGFYQYAPVLPNHPKDSWFGVQVTHDQTHWIDKEGNERDINTGAPWFPF
ncbi:RHS repeat-associated core domain-containing protein, partial [Microcoleus sp. PH2017_28_MFU_U_A]|uniref:RHS repeat-associated core domain-containing protein n=1 Tax=Microcoleus sp. PH2017_28_MFU_U_A TaxID=2798838 RepID=UPI001DE9F795